jgi:hypothetical protein
VNTPSGTAARSAHRLSGPAIQEFETAYRANFGAITAFYARRCADPQTVLDLTSETFVEAIDSLGTFDPRKGTVRAWVFGIARRIYAQHCARIVDGRNAATRCQRKRVNSTPRGGFWLRRYGSHRQRYARRKHSRCEHKRTGAV